MTIQRSPEQQAIRDYLLTNPSSSIIINAVAGSGKTWTLIDSLDAIGETGSICLTAFNKKMAVELESRVSRLPPNIRMNCEVGTAHSLAFRGLKKAGFKPRVYGGKGIARLSDLLDEKGISLDRMHPLRRGASIIAKLSGLAKNAGFGLTACDGRESFPHSADEDAWLNLIDHYSLEPDIEDKELTIPQTVEWGMRLFEDSIETGQRVIDFDDMIYFPLRLACKLPTYGNVLVDEAQDTNATRRELAIRSLRKSEGRSARLIAVGDPHQAIYGFTGADAFALRNIQSRVDATELPLSVCWRCDEKIIAVARQWVPHIRSHDTHGNGEVSDIHFDQLWDTLRPGDAVLCRLNRPNVSVCIALIRRGVKARIEGRDLGERLLSHARKASKAPVPLDQLALLLEGYAAHQIDLLQSANKPGQAALLEDEIDALQVLIERCLEQGKSSIPELEALVTELFVDGGDGQAVLLSSIHKAKGLEWDRVFWLGKSDYQPFFLAQQEWELQQEDNLCYVAATRAAHQLFIVDGVEESLKAGKHRQAPASSPAPPKPTVEIDDLTRGIYATVSKGIEI